MTSSPRHPETLAERLAIIRAALTAREAGIPSLLGLDGCPSGGWGETAQARSRIRDELTSRAERAYTVGDLIEAIYYIDHADRYRLRPGMLAGGER